MNQLKFGGTPAYTLGIKIVVLVTEVSLFQRENNEFKLGLVQGCPLTGVFRCLFLIVVLVL